MYIHKILLPDGTVLTSGNAGTDAIRSVSLTEQVNDETDLCPGAACAACAEIELWAPQNGLTIQQGTEIKLYRIDGESGTEEAMGIFLAEKPQKKSANVIKVTAYDRMILLDKDLSPWMRDQQSAFPMTLAAFIRAVCGQCGIAPDESTLDRLPNADYQIKAFYADDLTGRQLIQWAAQAACCFARMTPDGLLAFAWYAENAATGIFPDATEHWVALDLSGQILTCSDGSIWTYNQNTATYYSGGLTYEDYATVPLDKVQIRQSDTDVGVIWPPDAAGTNALVLQGNLLLTTDSAAALQPVAQAIYERLQRVTYTPLEVSLPCTVDMPAPGQIITVADSYGRQLQMYIMQRIITGQKVTLKATGNASRDGTAAVNQQKYSNLQGKVLEIQTSVDGLKVTASDMQENYTQLSQDLNGLELNVVKDGEVRTAFAADDASVSIKTGLISFESNTISVKSDNFKLDKAGSVTASGTFSTNNGISGNGRNEAELASGGLTFYRIDSTGSRKKVAQLYGEGNSTALGDLILYGPDAGNNPIIQAEITTSLVGGRLSMRDASGTQQVIFNASGGNGQLSGNLDVQGPVGLGVTQTVSCQNLDCWGSKSRVVPVSVGAVKMAALESPEPGFCDSGSACLDDGGICLLDLEFMYGEAIDSSKQLRWYITPTSEGSAWVEKRSGCALVHGTPGLSFDWICIGAQRGYADVYAERCYDSQPTATPDAERELDMLDSFDLDQREDQDWMLDGYDYNSFTESLFDIGG